MDNNLLESLLDLEEDFYKEGFDLGAADGAEAGYTEGSVFAVEKGFEKFIELGKLYGKALVWAQRLHDMKQNAHETLPNPESITMLSEEGNTLRPSVCKGMAEFPHSSRLAKNLDTLLELVDPASLPMQNTEEAVTDVDGRLKGAIIKAKLIQRAFGEREDPSDLHPDAKSGQVSGDGTGSIEDISSLNIRH
ncbi:Yae1 family protein [Aspergillus foveolatus]|uniref:Yae1 family protein n=1 Tax=Aspergillus foveolatus TaxID=210207 RepID=UPI003CCCC9BA